MPDLVTRTLLVWTLRLRRSCCLNSFAPPSYDARTSLVGPRRMVLAASLDASRHCCAETVKEPLVIVATRVLVEHIDAGISGCEGVGDDVTCVAEVDNDAPLGVV